MSNLGAYGGAKNPPWAHASRSNMQNSANNLMAQNNSLQQQLLNQSGLGNMNNSGLMQFQQQHQPQVFQVSINTVLEDLNDEGKGHPLAPPHFTETCRSCLINFTTGCTF